MVKDWGIPLFPESENLTVYNFVLGEFIIASVHGKFGWITF